MLRIRLRRVGAKKQPSFRIVVAESTAPRDGKFVEVIGFYNPRTEPETVTIDEARALHWLSVGASPSDSVVRIFTTHGTMDRFERLRAGESLEELVAEAEAVVEAAKPTTAEEVEAEPEAESAPEPASEEAPEPEAEVEAEAGPDVDTDVEEVAEVGDEEEAELEELAAETEESEEAV